MRLATVGADYQKRTIAAIVDERVVDLGPALAKDGRSWRDLSEVFDDGPDALHELTALANGVAGDEEGVPVEETSFLVPTPRPAHIICVAANFRDHILETGTIDFVPGHETSPWLFNKPQSALNAHGAPIRLPRQLGTQVDWEAELGVVIGRRASSVAQEEALDYVAGYTVINDVSARSMNLPNRTKVRPRDTYFDWLHGKWFDTFCCVGPWITTADEIPDPSALELSLSLNGEVSQKAMTGDMLFSPQELIAFISQIVTLVPGDVIATGTPAGTGKARGRFLLAGDVVTASVSGVGSLVNPVAAADD